MVEFIPRLEENVFLFYSNDLFYVSRIMLNKLKIIAYDDIYSTPSETFIKLPLTVGGMRGRESV